MPAAVDQQQLLGMGGPPFPPRRTLVFDVACTEYIVCDGGAMRPREATFDTYMNDIYTSAFSRASCILH